MHVNFYRAGAMSQPLRALTAFPVDLGLNLATTCWLKLASVTLATGNIPGTHGVHRHTCRQNIYT